MVLRLPPGVVVEERKHTIEATDESEIMENVHLTTIEKQSDKG